MNRPVKLYVTREQGFTVASFRAETRQEVKIGADTDGLITSFLHAGRELTSRPDTYFVYGAENTTRMYRAKNIKTRRRWCTPTGRRPASCGPRRRRRISLRWSSPSTSWRARPIWIRSSSGSATMSIVIRCSGVPFTSRSLVECFQRAGAAFGWSDYTPGIGSMTDGDDLVGWGVATASYPTQMSPCAVRVSLDHSGNARAQVASHDVGTGAYTVIAQAVHENLGVPLERVRVELGDSRLPPGTIAGGSISTASNVSAVGIACDRIRERLKGDGDGSDFDVPAALKRLGQSSIEEYAEYIPDLLKQSKGSGTIRDDAVRIVGGAAEQYAAFAFGAEFVEVRVNRFTREIRVPRIVGAFAAGRIMNEKTARSQYLGGMVWGISHALLEISEVDPRTGAYMNDNISEYLVPVNADIQQIEAILVPEVDHKVNPAGIKGIGEIGIVGTAAAVANAVYHATGIRVRKTPIRIEDLLAGS